MIAVAESRALSSIRMTPAAEPMVRVNGLVKHFRVRRTWSDIVRLRPAAPPKPALAGVTFTAAPGEIVGLLGPNGAGKTTLLKILSTLVIPDGGSAEVGGFDVVKHGTQARRLLSPVAADERSLDWRLSARENLRFFGTLHGMRGPALRDEIEKVLTSVGLADTAEKLVGAFSSGMRQRLLIARGLLGRPRVMLLDEPTRSLDPLAARAFREFIRAEVAGHHGCAILLATHDPSEAMEMCDRIAILDRGRILALGTPASLTREFGEERYRAWTTTPAHRSFGLLRDSGIRAEVRPELEAEGWSVVELQLRDGVHAPSAVLAMLIAEGVPIERFEKVTPSVADLMDRVVRRRAAHA